MEITDYQCSLSIFATFFPFYYMYDRWESEWYSFSIWGFNIYNDFQISINVVAILFFVPIFLLPILLSGAVTIYISNKYRTATIPVYQARKIVFLMEGAIIVLLIIWFLLSLGNMILGNMIPSFGFIGVLIGVVLVIVVVKKYWKSGKPDYDTFNNAAY